MKGKERERRNGLKPKRRKKERTGTKYIDKK